MRTIKFKVWDKEEQYFNNDYSINGNLIYGYCEGKKMSKKEQCKLVFLQYTGLLDKNGKEIYEGDIVKVIMYSNKIKTGYIKFSKKEACFTLNNGMFIGRYKREIIGNIYENKDLLT